MLTGGSGQIGSDAVDAFTCTDVREIVVHNNFAPGRSIVWPDRSSSPWNARLLRHMEKNRPESANEGAGVVSRCSIDADVSDPNAGDSALCH